MLCSCGGDVMRTEKEIESLLLNIEKGNLHLTIYYFSPSKLTLLHVSVNDLVDGGYDYKFSIDDTSLNEHIELFEKLRSANLEPAKQKSRIDARIYYVFEDSKSRKIFDVAMWGDNDSIYVNGVEFQWETVFYEIIRPFFPEDIKEFMDRQCDVIMQDKNLQPEN